MNKRLAKYTLSMSPNIVQEVPFMANTRILHVSCESGIMKLYCVEPATDPEPSPNREPARLTRYFKIEQEGTAFDGRLTVVCIFEHEDAGACVLLELMDSPFH